MLANIIIIAILVSLVTRFLRLWLQQLPFTQLLPSVRNSGEIQIEEIVLQRAVPSGAVCFYVALTSIRCRVSCPCVTIRQMNRE